MVLVNIFVDINIVNIFVDINIVNIFVVETHKSLKTLGRDTAP